ncbi:MAG: Uncharacterized protein G01um101416_732 [Microgenomates group bacterium Gr01-1014_16]|nr:MAG: Uncharacterized protein G01um101416_732 [Microgenomates group bacterium Gr01-1014_16]
MKVFVDSDVVISSLISDTGASAQLLKTNNEIKKIISNLSQKELEIVKARLKIDRPLPKLETIIISNIKKYSIYSTDPNDAHIVAGAHQAKARFLITYNLKHYRIEKIKQDMNIIVMTPGTFLQYLRLGKKVITGD